MRTLATRWSQLPLNQTRIPLGRGEMNLEAQQHIGAQAMRPMMQYAARIQKIQVGMVKEMCIRASRRTEGGR